MDLFLTFSIMALQGFGGVLAVVQRVLVEQKRWLTNEQFLEDWAVSQVMPGPNIANMALIFGSRHFGLRGALAALAGLFTVPLIATLLLAFFYAKFSSYPQVANALRGMGAVAAGMIIGMGLKLASGLRKHPLGTPVCVLLGGASFVGVALLRWPLVYVLPSLGLIACGVTYLKIKR
ncbi:chromate transporter [Noviherbaspirillum aerium]|uniref:chromate transporter n=1 Tax=Noviherbaspirillum aerium TaxID=2588497 RepID=UPI001CEF88A2|nr:chromate transporter [Noviherbaspirillum aerium]